MERRKESLTYYELVEYSLKGLGHKSSEEIVLMLKEGQEEDIRRAKFVLEIRKNTLELNPNPNEGELEACRDILKNIKSAFNVRNSLQNQNVNI